MWFIKTSYNILISKLIQRIINKSQMIFYRRKIVGINYFSFWGYQAKRIPQNRNFAGGMIQQNA